MPSLRAALRRAADCAFHTLLPHSHCAATARLLHGCCAQSAIPKTAESQNRCPKICAAKMSQRLLKSFTLQLTSKCHEMGFSVEGFLADFVSRYLMLSFLGGTSPAEQPPAADLDRLLDIGVAVLTGVNGPQTTPADVTSHTLRMLGVHTQRFAAYHMDAAARRDAAGALATDCFMRCRDQETGEEIYGTLEGLLLALLRPPALGDAAPGAQPPASALKIALSSVLPSADVVLFRDMLAREHESAGAPAPAAPVSAGVAQLLELVDVASGVALVGDPPLTRLDALEQTLDALARTVAVQFAQAAGVYVASVVPLLFYTLDLGSTADRVAQARARETIVYALNRVALVKALSYLAREAHTLAARARAACADVRAGVAALQRVLEERDSVPKAQVYPRFAAVAQGYREAHLAGEALASLKGWHSDLLVYVDDSAFSVLPQASARAALFSMEDLSKARAWYAGTYRVLAEAQEPGDDVPSRLLRLALGVTARVSGLPPRAGYVRDLSGFAPLDGDGLQNADYLFGGLDPMLCVAPGFSRPGAPMPVVLPGLSTTLARASELAPQGSTSLSLPGTQDAVEACLRVAPSDLAAGIIVVPEGADGAGGSEGSEGFGLVAASSVHTRAMLMMSPVLFLAAPLALSLGSPEFMPLVLLMDLPRVAGVLQQDALGGDREAFIVEHGGSQIDLQPCFHNGVVDVNPPANGLDALITAGGERGMQTDSCGFVHGAPGFTALASRLIMQRHLSLTEMLRESSAHYDILNAPFAIKDLLSPATLREFEGLTSDPVFTAYRAAEAACCAIRGRDLVPVAPDGSPKRHFRGGQTGAADGRARGSGRSSGRSSGTGTGAEPLGAQPQDMAIQTPLHFYERHIVPGYTSSEWELRSRALRLYQLQHKLTHVTQTASSTFKAAGGTQTVGRADAEVQSGHDASAHAKQHFRYVRRPVPASLDDLTNRAAKACAGGVRARPEVAMVVDLDDVARDAARFQALRQQGRHGSPGSPGLQHQQGPPLSK